MDTRTIFQITAVVVGCIFAYLVLIHISTPALRGLRAVCYGYAAACVGIELISQRGHIPDFFSVLLSSLLLVLINVCLYRGLSELLCVKASYKWLVAGSLAPILIVTTYYTYVHVQDAPRLIVYSAVIFVQNILLALLILRNGSPHTRLPRFSMALLFLIWAGINLLRICFAMVAPHPSVFPTAVAVNSMVVIIPVLGAVLTGLAFIWLAISKLQRELELQSRTDALTGLLNRRALDLTVTREIARARRAKAPFSTIILDLDSFKAINDRYGHDAGDLALSITANLLTESLRTIDLIARLGGEEFVIFLPDATCPVAAEVAERLRLCVNGLTVHHGENQIHLSASFGVTELSLEDLTWEDMMRRADRALYRAKNEGKDRVVVL